MVPTSARGWATGGRPARRAGVGKRPVPPRAAWQAEGSGAGWSSAGGGCPGAMVVGALSACERGRLTCRFTRTGGAAAAARGHAPRCPPPERSSPPMPNPRPRPADVDAEGDSRSLDTTLSHVRGLLRRLDDAVLAVDSELTEHASGTRRSLRRVQIDG